MITELRGCPVFSFTLVPTVFGIVNLNRRRAGRI